MAMGKYKVCVYAICKNEEKFVEEWMASMQEADQVVVTDTGSQDDTVKRLKELGAVVYTESIEPFRFDVARNISLSHVPEDVDICVCTDFDERLEKGWREKLEAAWEEGICQGKYLYNCSVGQDSKPFVQFIHFKVHTRKDFTWVYPCHEVLKYTGQSAYKEVFIDGFVLNHYPQEKKSRGSYLELLKLAVKEQPEDPRMNYYLGREYIYQEDWENAIKRLSAYLELKDATWREERGDAMRYIAFAYSKQNKYRQAYQWYYRAIAEVSWMRDGYVEFAKFAFQMGDFKTTYYMATEAIKIKTKSKVYINHGDAWDSTPYDLAGIGAFYIGLYEESYQYIKEAVSISPKDQRLLSNLQLVKGTLDAIREKRKTI